MTKDIEDMGDSRRSSAPAQQVYVVKKRTKQSSSAANGKPGGGGGNVANGGVAGAVKKINGISSSNQSCSAMYFTPQNRFVSQSSQGKSAFNKHDVAVSSSYVAAASAGYKTPPPEPADHSRVFLAPVKAKRIPETMSVDNFFQLRRLTDNLLYASPLPAGSTTDGVDVQGVRSLGVNGTTKNGLDEDVGESPILAGFGRKEGDGDLPSPSELKNQLENVEKPTASTPKDDKNGNDPCNCAEAQEIRNGFLPELGNSADLWILNSCTVKTPSETQVHNYIEAAQSLNIPVVISGCVSQAAPNTPWLKGLSLIGVQQIDRIVEVVEETLKGNMVRILTPRKEGGKRIAGAPLDLPKIRRNPLIEILAINTGCLNTCTYCKTKQARGDLSSYPIEDLVARAVQSFKEGVKEIWLTSEDLGAYGRDIELTLPDLLTELVKVIPDGCRMRLGMTNPPYILDHLEDIAKILNHPRVYKFIHIPVQSGSDAVLVDMRREYSSTHFRQVVEYLQTHVPGVYIATDVICGFPTETADDFNDTLNLVLQYKFPSLYINQYYPRPNTPAARMKRIDTVEVKRRTKAVTEAFASYSHYEGMEGKSFEVLVTEEATNKSQLVAHTDSYYHILVPNVPWYMGQQFRVRVDYAGKYHLKGTPYFRDRVRLWSKYQLSRHRERLIIGAFVAVLGFRLYLFVKNR